MVTKGSALISLAFLAIGTPFSYAQGRGCTVGYSDVPCKSANLRTVMVAQDGSGDFRSISAAVAQAQPGDSILVKNGRYSEFFTVDRSGTADLPITIKNYPDAHPVIFAGAQRANEISIRGDWIIFQGFEIEKSWGGITVYGAHEIIRDNYIHDNGALSDPKGPLNGQGMLVVSTHDVLIDNNRFERNGIYHSDNSHMHGVYLTDYYYRGISNITLTKNYFEGHAGSGIQAWINRKANGGNHHLLIENNTFKNNAVELIFTFVEDTVVRNNTFIHDSHTRSTFKPEGFSAILWLELSRNIRVENNTFESKLNGPTDYVVFEKNRTDGLTYSGNTWKVPTHAVFRSAGNDYPDFASMFPKATNSSERIELTSGTGGVMPAPAAERSSTLSELDLQKFAGLFASRNPFAQIRVFVEGNSLKATFLHEAGQPSYSLRGLSPTRFHIEGSPAGFDVSFEMSGSRADTLTVHRPIIGSVKLKRER